MPHGQSAGYLGKTFDPFVLNADPNDKAFKVPDLLPPDYVTAVREDRRRSLRAAIDGAVGSFEASADARLLDANFEGAFKLMSSASAREAFDLKGEPDAVRDRYGRTRFGQSCLLARRLVERGVRFVTVNMFETVFNEITWDIHGSAPFSPIDCYKNEVGPNFDNAYTALLDDLSRSRPARQHDGPGLRRVRPDARRSTRRAAATTTPPAGPPSSRAARSRAAGSSAPRTRPATPPGPPRHHRRDRRDRLPGARHQPRHRAARPAGPAAPGRRPRGRADRRAVLNSASEMEEPCDI